MPFLPPLAEYAIIVLIVGVFVLMSGYLALKHFRNKRNRRPIITLFAMGLAGGIAYLVLFYPLYRIFNYAMPWHYNVFAAPQAIGVIAFVLLLCYIPALIFLGGVKPREALTIAVVTSGVSILALVVSEIIILTIMFTPPP